MNSIEIEPVTTKKGVTMRTKFSFVDYQNRFLTPAIHTKDITNNPIFMIFI